QQFMREQYNSLLSEVERGVNTYWLSKPLHVGIGQKHSLYLEGGDPAMRYSINFAYNNVVGVMKGSDRETVSGAINLSYRYKNIIFRNMLSVGFNRADDSPYGSFSDYSRLNPYWTEYDENGNIKRFLGSYSTPGSGGTTTNYANPLYNATVGTKNFSKYAEITENFYAEWKALESLKIIGRFGFTYNNDSREDFYPGDHTRFNDWIGENYFKRGSYSLTNGESKSVNASVTANYTGVFGSHMILANAGWNLSTSSNMLHGMSAQGFLNNRVDDITFAKQYQENGRPSGSEAVTRELGFIGAVNYSYDDRYLADISIRTNASSVFGANNRWGTFWSVGLGWNVHREKFLFNSKAINLLKIRGSAGYTGNQNFNPFQAMRTYQFFTDKLYDNISGAYLMALVNNNLQWQQTRDINGGIDLGMYKRLNIRFDAYQSITSNMLVDYTLPSSTGFNSYKENLGEVENKGFDLTASYMVYRNPEKDAFFSLNASAAHNINKLKKISSALTSSNEKEIDNVGTSPLTLYQEGQSLSVIWAVRSLGIDPITGQELYLKKDGTTTYTWDPLDQIVAGDTYPKVRGNIGFTSEYKGFGLSLSFRYTWGGDYYNSTLVNRVENVDVAYNVDRRVLTSTWHSPGDMVAYRRISTYQTSTRPTTRFVEKQNEFALSSLNFSYDFKHLNIKKYKMDRLKLIFYMNDVFRISTVEAERGLSYPFARSFSFSLTATF
ncbi:MAG: SusC/RagA family TonB-linked outer membrane protein, partial [Bacteroidales bacterium]|nr:SusC/RagA family TonB-linked outer membrane protein [Bacteroidales bacterium]